MQLSIEQLEALYLNPTEAGIDLHKLILHELGFRTTKRAKRLYKNILDRAEDYNGRVEPTGLKKTNHSGGETREIRGPRIPIKSLETMYTLGVKRAIHALQHDTKTWKQSSRLLDQLNEPVLRPRALTVSYKSFHVCSPLIYKLPLKFILAPFGADKLRRFSQQIDNSFLVSHAIEEFRDPKNAKTIKAARKYLPDIKANIIFHSQIIPYSFFELPENTRLRFIFPYSLDDQALFDLLALYSKNNDDLRELVLHQGATIRKATYNLVYQTRSWKAASFQQILSEAAWLPRKIGLSKSQISVRSKDYPGDLGRCSVFMLAASSKSPNVISKIEKLNEIGIVHISDLVLLEEALVPIWKKVTQSRIKEELKFLGSHRLP